MAKIQISTGDQDKTVNTNSVWDRIIGLENTLSTLPSGENLSEIQADVEEVSQQLAQKAMKSEVRLKIEKISQTDATEEFLQQMAGNTPINAVPADESINPNQTTFMRVVQNLFDKSTATSGVVSSVNGTIVANANYSASDYIPVKPSKTYKSTYCFDAAFYDVNKIFISGISAAVARVDIQTPANAVFLRITYAIADINNAMFAERELPKTYMSYGSYIFEATNNEFINMFNKQLTVSPDKTTFFQENLINLFDKNKVVSGAVSSAYGTINTFAGYSASDYIPVTAGKTYKTTLCYDGAYYKADKSFLSGLPNATARVSIVPPANAAFVRLTYANADLNTTMVSENELPSSYTSYGTTLFSFSKQQYIDDIKKAVLKNANSNWAGKIADWLGDSIIWQDGKPYGGVGNPARGCQTIVKEKLGLNYNNHGVSGTTIADSANGSIKDTGKTVSYANSDLVIISGGTNDFRLNIPLGTKGIIGDTTFDVATFYGAYRELIEYILTNKPTVRLVLFTPLQQGLGGKDVNHVNTAGHKLIDYVNAIISLGEMYGIPVCDMYRNSGITKLNFATYLRDLLHPNDVGYVRMGGYASSFINAV